MYACTYISYHPIDPRAYLLRVDLEEEAGTVVPQHGRDLVVPCFFFFSNKYIGRDESRFCMCMYCCYVYKYVHILRTQPHRLGQRGGAPSVPLVHVRLLRNLFWAGRESFFGGGLLKCVIRWVEHATYTHIPTIK